MNPFLTIIVPVYNTEYYIGRTLDSILSQNYLNYEILLINDGSNDNSNTVCQKYANQNHNIIFIDKKNEGVATTRNRGLDIAKGEYIMFIDSDDIIYPNTLDKIVKVLKETNADMFRFDFSTIDKNDKIIHPNYLSKKRIKHSNCLVPAAHFMKKVMRDEYFLCMNTFRKSIIDDNKIRFKNGCTYNEDTLFIMQFMQYSENHVYVPIIFYGYRKYSGAVTAKFTEKNYKDVKMVFYELVLLAKCAPKDLSFSMQPTIQHLGWHVYQEADKFHDSKGKQEVKSLCTKQPVLSEWNMITLLGDVFANKIYPFVTIYKRIIRKIEYFVS